MPQSYLLIVRSDTFACPTMHGLQSSPCTSILMPCHTEFLKWTCPLIFGYIHLLLVEGFLIGHTLPTDIVHLDQILPPEAVFSRFTLFAIVYQSGFKMMRVKL